jgi:hypothetical protein
MYKQIVTLFFSLLIISTSSVEAMKRSASGNISKNHAIKKAKQQTYFTVYIGKEERHIPITPSNEYVEIAKKNIPVISAEIAIEKTCPYKNLGCEYKVAKKEDMKRHIERHNIDCKVCLCGYRCIRADCYKIHMARHKKNGDL